MTQTLVPAVATPHTLDEAVTAFVEGWPLAVVDPRTPEAIGVAVAHCALECGNFGYRNGVPSNPPTLYCENLGNTRAAQGEDCEVCEYSGDEVIAGKVVKFAPPDPLSRFRSFRSFAEGVAAQLAFLGRPESRYHQAWLRLLAGDPAGFVQQLKAHGYFTGDEAPYERAVVSIFAKVVPVAARIIAGEDHGVTDADRQHVHDQVALFLADAAQAADTEPAPPPSEVA